MPSKKSVPKKDDALWDIAKLEERLLPSFCPSKNLLVQYTRAGLQLKKEFNEAFLSGNFKRAEQFAARLQEMEEERLALVWIDDGMF